MPLTVSFQYSASLVKAVCQVIGLITRCHVQEFSIVCITLLIPCRDVAVVEDSRYYAIRCLDDQFTECCVGMVQVGSSWSGKAG